MLTGPAPDGGTARGVVPLRGTQSFVGVFAQVWKRPSLTAFEILWRWVTAVPLLALGWRAEAPLLRRTHLDWAALQAMTIFRPAELARTVEQAVEALRPPVWHVLRWWLPLAFLVWTGAGVLGHQWIWRRQDPALRGRTAPAALLTYSRSFGLLCMFALWGVGVWQAGRVAVLNPAEQGGEPNLVLFAALAVGTTLILFVGWSLLSWWLDAARLLAMRDGTGIATSLRVAGRAAAFRSKLIELNLVMGIVRVSLIVLATVAAATPLPFESVEGATFLSTYWTIVGLVYLVVSDLFQVVRRSAGLYLMRALERGSEA